MRIIHIDPFNYFFMLAEPGQEARKASPSGGCQAAML